MIFDSRNLWLHQHKHRQATAKTDSRKTSHRELFLESKYRLFVKGAFLLQNPPLFQSQLGLKNSPAKALER